MDNEEIRKKVDAKWFNEALYMISKSYEAALTKEEQKAVVEYDWNSFIPDNAYSIDNKFENEIYKKLYSMWMEKKWQGIHRYFLKKRCYQQVKKIKRKLLK